MQTLARSLLRLRLALSRCGTGTVLAGALLAAAALLWLGLLPGMAARVEDQTRSVTRLAALPPPKPVVPAPVLAAGRLADFYAGLGDSAHTGEIVTRLFEAAAAAGVTLDKAEYKPGHDTPGRFDTYTITLPVKGDYARLRQFSEKVLVAVPYAALDDLRFKRNSANDPGVEANLRFTTFLRPVTIAPVSASAVAAAAEVASGAGAAVGASGASGAAAAASASASAMPAASVTDTTRRAGFGAAQQRDSSEVPLPTSGGTVSAVAARALTVVPVTAAPVHGERGGAAHVATVAKNGGGASAPVAATATASMTPAPGAAGVARPVAVKPPARGESARQDGKAAMVAVPTRGVVAKPAAVVVAKASAQASLGGPRATTVAVPTHGVAAKPATPVATKASAQASLGGPRATTIAMPAPAVIAKMASPASQPSAQASLGGPQATTIAMPTPAVATKPATPASQPSAQASLGGPRATTIAMPAPSATAQPAASATAPAIAAASQGAAP